MLVGISAFLIIILLIIVGTAVLFRPKPAQPDTPDWQTGMVFFSVGDSWKGFFRIVYFISPATNRDELRYTTFARLHQPVISLQGSQIS